MKNKTRTKAEMQIRQIEHDFAVSDLDSPLWSSGIPVKTDTYWSGEAAPDDRVFETVLLWSASALYVRFAAAQGEDLVVSETPALHSKTIGLWDRDVCEIFVAPEPFEPSKYLEFEVAPTGEWLDVAIENSGRERKSDWDYRSGLEVAARVETSRVLMAMRIPWQAFGKRPAVGEVWLGNLYRCVGSGPDRGYLAWQPTLTEKPNFHLPESFGRLIFEN